MGCISERMWGLRWAPHYWYYHALRACAARVRHELSPDRAGGLVPLPVSGVTMQAGVSRLSHGGSQCFHAQGLTHWQIISSEEDCGCGRHEEILHANTSSPIEGSSTALGRLHCCPSNMSRGFRVMIT